MRALLAALVLAAACTNEIATPAVCTQILDHIVELELRERGYKDAELTRRKQVEMRALLAPELERCKGRVIKRDALECIARAKNTEQITHGCLH